MVLHHDLYTVSLPPPSQEWTILLVHNPFMEKGLYCSALELRMNDQKYYHDCKLCCCKDTKVEVMLPSQLLCFLLHSFL